MFYRLQILFILLSVIGFPQTVNLSKLGSYKTGRYQKGAMEISAYDEVKKRLFVVNADSIRIDVIDLSNVAEPKKLFHVNLNNYGAIANSVKVKGGYVVAAVEDTIKQNPGKVLFFDTDGNFVKSVTVGALPDNIVWSESGKIIMTANEGEPNSDYTVDPDGSISIIDVSGGVASVDQSKVTTLDFSAFNSQVATLDSTLKIFGPGANVQKDLEPEYIAISPNELTAWVTLQENNGLAIVDLTTKTIKKLTGLGYKNHRLSGNDLDASDKDGAINIRNWPLFGAYQPDEMQAFTYNGKTYLVMANEGDARDYSGYVEEFTLSEQKLNPAVFPVSDSLWLQKNLGRLKFTSAKGTKDSVYSYLVSFGARSFSIRDSVGALVWDSGDQIERYIANNYPTSFNVSNTNNTLENRSDDKGPEPEGVAIGKIGNKLYAFVGLERHGGIMVYDISNPMSPTFVQYAINRDFTIKPADSTALTVGDLGPEGIIFIPAEKSPNNMNLLVTANEISGTVTIWSTDDIVVPVELTTFSGSVNEGVVSLSWETATELNNKGFEVQFSQDGSDFEAVGFVEGFGTNSETSKYSFEHSTTYEKNYYRLKQIDYDGSYTLSQVIEIDNLNPIEFNLQQNYPNPFNPSTVIRYSLPITGMATLKVFNVMGEEISTLVNEVKDQGIYEVALDMENYSSGVYFYKLIASGFTSSKKMMLTK